jgi:hypothetical protein
MVAIPTPDDERPDWLYPPFREGWHYVGATYAGHSPYSVDWNRRTRTGGWLDDDGDPVLAPQDGIVAEVDKGDGVVMLLHHGGLTQVELRHMQDILVKPGQRVKRGERVGSIGNVAGDGRSFGPHLHMVQYARPDKSQPFARVPLTIEGKRIATSVQNSDSKPAGWTPPDPVMVQGPPAPVTWEQTAKAALKALEKAEATVAAQKAQTELATDERNAARREAALLTTTVAELRTALTAAEKRITELENATPLDCDAAINAAVNETVAAITASLGKFTRGVVG